MSKPKYIHTEYAHNRRDAQEMIPHILELFNPKSVVDIGCGLGTFLAVFKDAGIADIVGVEGAWLDTSKTLVPTDNIVIADLEKTVDLKRRFDLAVCLEVAEHLSREAADNLIDTLTGHSDLIIFSAAIPHQGGQNHINEQWVGYWQLLFKARGYEFFDILRSRIWDNPNIFWWYRQNVFVVLKESVTHNFHKTPIYNYIHPDHYIYKMDAMNGYLARLKYYENMVDKIMAGEIEITLAREIMAKVKKVNSSKKKRNGNIPELLKI